MVCIIDDRDDVWQGCANLVQVKPYHFFLHTGDINVPPGLGKHDDPSPPKSFTEEALQDTNSNDSTENLQFNKDNKNNKNEGQDEEKNEDQDEDENEDKDDNNEIKEKGIDENKDTDTEVHYKSTKNPEDVEEGQSKKNDGIIVAENTGEDDNIKDTSKNNSESAESNDTCSKKDSKSKSTNSEKLKTKRKHGRDKKEKQKQEEKPQFNSKEMEDQDDYLLYLEDILKRIHTEFYTQTEIETKSKTLREIIPKVRSRVLEGLCLTFSGLVPNNQKLHQSRAYKVARAFGAQVSQVLIHLLKFCISNSRSSASYSWIILKHFIKVNNSDEYLHEVIMLYKYIYNFRTSQNNLLI
jgi:RNA polymerase II subunit A-like phosphatase